MNSLDMTCIKTEAALNDLGKLPVVGILSGAIRVLFGTAEMISAIAVAIFTGFAAIYHACAGNELQLDECRTWANNSLNYFFQGFFNTFRGALEIAQPLGLAIYLSDLKERRRHSYEAVILQYPSEPQDFRYNIQWFA